ncbi:MAG: CpXC domain-containing protein [Myxococcota bacterium]|nr:CpXC domain-containing protein [Myxococcota bacterium]
MRDGGTLSNDASAEAPEEIERRAAAAWARGQTRRVRVTYGCACGTLAGAEAVTVLDVRRNPDLAEELLAGEMNRAACPACGVDQLLRLPVVAHDPASRRVVICAGEGDRHRALDLLIRYLEGLRDQPGDSVPAYAIEPELAFGRQAWRARLSAPPRAAAAAVEARLDTRGAAIEKLAAEVEKRAADANRRDAEIESRERAFSDRQAGLDAAEARIAERESAVQGAAARLRKAQEQVETARADVRRREEDIELLKSAVEDREALLRAREEDLELLESDARGRPAPAVRAVAPVHSAGGRSAASRLDAPRTRANPRGEAARVPAPAPEPIEELPGLLEPDEDEDGGEPVAIRDSDIEVERVLESDTDVSRIGAAAEDAASPAGVVRPTAVRRAQTESLPDVSVVEVAPDDLVDARQGVAAEHVDAWLATDLPTLAHAGGEGVRLYRRSRPEPAAAGRGPSSLACRRFEHAGDLWMEIAVVASSPAGPEVLDTWLAHPSLAEDESVFRRLSERFEALIVEVDDAGNETSGGRLEAPLARNIVRIEDACRRRGAPSGARAAAIAAARAAGSGWLDRSGLPPFEPGGVPDSPPEILTALVELTPWMAEEAEEKLVLDRSVPAGSVDSYRRAVLSAAMRAGLWLPPKAAARAVAGGLAPSPEMLVTLLADNFFRCTAGRVGLGPDLVARNWLYLVRDADRMGVRIDPRRRAVMDAVLVQAGSIPAVEASGGPETAGGDRDILLRWLAVDSGRTAALRELLRGGSGDMPPAFAAALDALGPLELADALVSIRESEDALGELLIGGLSASGRPLRLASAAGLGKLGLRRAVVPLVNLLLRADSADWRFVGAAIASYGTSALKAIEPMLGDAGGREDRLAWTLACFTGAAAERHLAVLRQEEEAMKGTIARRAADLRGDAESFRAKLASDEHDRDAFAFVRLVRSIVGGDPAEEIGDRVDAIRAAGGMDI